MAVFPSLTERATVAEILCMMNPMQRFLLAAVVSNYFLEDREAPPLGETPCMDMRSIGQNHSALSLADVSGAFSCLRSRGLKWDSQDALGKGHFQKKPDIESNTISAQRESLWLPMGMVLKFFHIGCYAYSVN